MEIENEKPMSMEEIRAQMEHKTPDDVIKNVDNNESEYIKEEVKTDIVVTEQQSKSLTEVGLSDIKFKLNTDKSYEEQTEDIVGAMATVKAVTNEETAKDIADRKAEELKKKAAAKAKQAETAELEAETEKQKAQRGLYEAVLEDFMITKHLPSWLMVIIVIILSPLYLAKTLIICVPLGFAKTLMDCADNIFVRYNKVEENNKPKVRVTVWFILIALVIAAAAYVTLRCLGKI